MAARDVVQHCHLLAVADQPWLVPVALLAGAWQVEALLKDG
jgi:hypothetical protein